MAAAGCGRIVLNGRSEPKSEAVEVIERIRSGGTEIEVERGDIAEPGTALRLVEAATASGLELRGVLHAAALVEDATLVNITDQLIDRDWGPKVLGAWNLHQATVGLQLDWFCSFSSAAALVGSPGQVRRIWPPTVGSTRSPTGGARRNLPATAIAWGAWSEIGRGQAMAEQTDSAIAPDESAYAFEALLRYDRAYTGYTPSWVRRGLQRSLSETDSRSSSPWGRGRSEGAASSSRNSARCPRKNGRASYAPWLASRSASSCAGRSTDRPLAEYRLDSLGNLEVRTRIETGTGIRISPADITTVRNLAAHLHDALAAQPTPRGNVKGDLSCLSGRCRSGRLTSGRWGRDRLCPGIRLLLRAQRRRKPQ